jgi:polysaccharide chain length determinant protein (PEP-CTERM system associated)
MTPGKTYAPDELARLAWARKWLIVLPFLLCTGATIVALQFIPNRYRSETLILVVPQRVPESYVRSTVTTKIEDRLQSISQQILSRTRLERIIQDFDLYKSERQAHVMEDVVQDMRKQITVQMVKGDAFRVSYVSGDARTAMKVTERLASLLIEENLRDREVLAEATNQFLDTQLEDARRRLEEYEKELEQYRLQFSGQLPSQLESNLQVVQNAQLQIQALQESVNRDLDRRLLLERSMRETKPSEVALAPAVGNAPADASAVPVGGSPAAQLDAARASLRVLQSRLTPQHPDIVRLTRVVAELEGKVQADAEGAGKESAGSDALPPGTPVDEREGRLRDLQVDLANLDRQIAEKQARERMLQDRIGAYQARVEAAPTRESELVALTRDYETLRNVYAELLAKREESKVAANLERRQIGEQFKILDAARLPEKPFSPNRPLVALLGALAGLGLGVGLVGFLEYRDVVLRTEEDIKRVLNLPVLALVPRALPEIERRRRRRRRVAVSCAAAIAFVAAAVGVYLTFPAGW